MTTAEFELLGLLVDINGMECQCKTVEIDDSIPSAVVFNMIQLIRDKICDFGIVHVVKEYNSKYHGVKLLTGRVD